MVSRKLAHPVDIENQSKLAIRSLLGFAILGVLLSGCTIVGPGFEQPSVQMLSSQYQTRESLQQPAQELDTWWRSFTDPTLDQLVSQSLANNLTVQIAAERIIEARANVNLNGGNLLPTVNSTTGYEYLKRSPNARPFVGSNGDPFQLFNLGLDSSWEIDLFGRLERSIQAAEAELMAQEYSLQDVQQTLVADVASSYLSIRLLQNQIEIVDKSLQLQQETTSVVGSRAKAGVATELDSEQTVAFFHRTRADKATLELQLDAEFNRLSILLGESPASPLREFVGIGAIPDSPYLPAAGIPTDLLRRRPDIRQAEAIVAAATARIGVAEADLYPSLTLLGTIGVSAQDVSSLFQTDSFLFNVGPSFTWNILSFGRINNNIEIHESLMRQAAGSYRVVVLDAVQEVEDAMARYEGYRKQLEALESAVQSDAKAVELSLERYEVGKSNFQRVLDAQVQMLQDSQAVAAARANANIQLIKLYKAVGGGWQAPTAASGCAGCVAESQTGSEVNVQSFHQEEFQDVTYHQNQTDTTQSVLNSEVTDLGTADAIGDEHVEVPYNHFEDGQRHGKTILNVEEKQPEGAQTILPPKPLNQSMFQPEDFGPIEFNPNLGQNQQVPSQQVGKNVLAEMFDWDATDAAVVKSSRQIQSPVSGNATAGYFAESPRVDSKRNTQKASSIRRAPMVWDSEAVKVD